MIYVVRFEYRASASPDGKRGLRGYEIVTPNTEDKAYKVADALRRAYPNTFQLVWVEKVDRINHLELLQRAM